jgi:hypothetical protein
MKISNNFMYLQMKKHKKLFLCFILCLLLVGSISTTAHAETNYNDGLNVEINTDKDSYNQSDNANITVTVTNYNVFDVKEVHINTILPEGLEPVDSGILTKSIDSLASGDSIQFSVKIKAKITNTNSNENNSNNNLINTNSNNDLQQSNDNISLSGKSPNTFDINNTFYYIIFIMLSLTAILIFYKKNKKTAKKIFSLFLCITLLMPMFADSRSVKAATDTSSIKNISISKNIKYVNQDYDIKADVSYQYDVETDQITYTRGEWIQLLLDTLKINQEVKSP